MLHAHGLKVLFAGTCVALIAAGSIAWQNHHGNVNSGDNQQDTIPKREKKIRNKEDKTIITGDIDKTMKELDRSLENMGQQLDGKSWEKLHRELEISLQKINTEKIEQQVEQAMKNIDMQEIQLQAQAELKKVDWEKMQKEIQKALEEAKHNLDSKKVEIEIQKAIEESKIAMAEMKEVNMEKIREELNVAKEQMKSQQGRMKEEIEEVSKELKQNLDRDLKKEMANAKEQLARAKEELQHYKDMLSSMEKDGLLNTKENYSVEYKNGELFINGKKQPDTITNKYRHYFKKEHVTIKKNGDDEDDRTIDL